jgi:cytochrome bd-type quinol oxidase subunit 2
MPPMSLISIVVGSVLTLYGAYSYSIAVEKSPTALIPAYFGVAFIALGVLAMRETLRKHAMHLAAMVGVIGFIGGAIMGFPKLLPLLSGEINDARTHNKAVSQNLLAFICLIFVMLCVNSFIQARRRRKSGTDVAQP